MKPYFKTLEISLLILLGMLLLGGSSLPPGDRLEQIRYFTRKIEFDYTGWTLKALGVKLEQVILGTASYIPQPDWSNLVLSYLELLQEINQVEGQIGLVYTDPNVKNPEVVASSLYQELGVLDQKRSRLEPVAESILQMQIGAVLAEAGLSLGGQTLPPVLFHTTPPPHGFIISSREVIRQEFNISISPEISLEEQIALENQVDQTFKVSSLIVGIGGIGLYPTMVMETTDINWLAEVVAHEWIHNYLTLRPLGLYYLTSPELRTMNETVASIAGKELGRLVVERFYPAYLPLPPPEPAKNVEPVEPLAFNFRAEMRQTRVWTDQLLAEGRVEEAEAYMELRRRFLWDNGYRIRKLNQAYFAFYGAYADDPEGGAAGEDPVGSAVRLFRQQSPTLREFVNQISWMVTFEQLRSSVERRNPKLD